jgi:hypothetical protein
LGTRPSPSPTSRLGDAIHAQGLRAAEDITVLLLGEEILSPDLSEQFVSLFRALSDPADRLALFGLGLGDPLAPRVLSAVDEFLRRPTAGARPWERIFRLLRVGVVQTSRPEKQPGTEPAAGEFNRLDEAECKGHGLEAERSGLLPPVPRDLLLRLPERARKDRDVECGIEVRPEDRRGGCSYEIPPDMRLRPSAPGYAPRSFP